MEVVLRKPLKMCVRIYDIKWAAREMIITTTVRIYEYEKPQQFQCLLLSKIDVMDK